jgi:hypothetical protein
MRGLDRSLAAPPRLAARDDRVGALVRAACGYRPAFDESSAYHRTLERFQRGQRLRFPRLAFASAVFLAGAVALLAVYVESRTYGRASLAGRANEPSVRSAERALLQGETKLEDGTRIHVAADGSARVETSPTFARIALESGTVTLDVARQPPGRSCEVLTRGYRFVVRGTSFSVSASEEHVELDVREGRVAVYRQTTFLAELGAGERWTDPTSARPNGPQAPKTPDKKAIPSDARRPPEPARASAGQRPSGDPVGVREEDCLALARAGRTRDAERCFAGQAAGSGLGAELALFELSRLRSDVLNDPTGALAALREHRTRFPNGSLRGEADISYLHLLSRVGNHSELLSESAKVLDTAKGRERSSELRMLRAKTLRVGMKDFAGAEREYGEVERAGGKFAADAGFYRGVCWEALGNYRAAADAYRRYLEVAGRPREAEARRRLRELEP